MVTKNGPEDTVFEVVGLRFSGNFPGCGGRKYPWMMILKSRFRFQ